MIAAFIQRSSLLHKQLQEQGFVYAYIVILHAQRTSNQLAGDCSTESCLVWTGCAVKLVETRFQRLTQRVRGMN